MWFPLMCFDSWLCSRRILLTRVKLAGSKVTVSILIHTGQKSGTPDRGEPANHLVESEAADFCVQGHQKSMIEPLWTRNITS